MTYIWRGVQTAGPFSVIDSTTAGTYTDNENPPAPSQRTYHITQQLAPGAATFHLPNSSRKARSANYRRSRENTEHVETNDTTDSK